MGKMGRRTKIERAGSSRGWGVSLLALAGLCGGLIVAPIGAHAGKQLTRVSAENTAIDGKAILLPSGTDTFSVSPTQIYSNSGAIPAGDNVVYVTMSSNGLGLCDGIALLCQVDGVNCITGKANNVTNTGWVVPAGDEFDFVFDGDRRFGLTGVNFQWCAKVSKTNKNIHSIKIFGATQFGDCNTYLEGVHVYIDTNRIPTQAGINVCGSYPTPNSVTSPD
jgi:hypothetical protein